MAFITSNVGWGGSEELWSAAAAVIAAAGHQVTVYKETIDEREPRIQRLRELKCTLRDLTGGRFVPRRLLLTFLSLRVNYGLQLLRLGLGLKLSRRPDLVVISQGGNQDGLFLADVCRHLKLPYVMILNKASDLDWPPDVRRERMRRVYQSVVECYFVSEHNRVLTEEQLGFELPHASVVRNPFLVPWERRSDWPDERDVVRLACIGRLNVTEKGQDLLLRVLAREHWQKRPLSVTFFGNGQHRAGLEAMARKLGLTSVSFAGFVHDVASIWNDHHGLILPSRCEGLPLVLVEAMLSGRVPIATDVAGHTELVDDEITGFVAAAPTEDALDEAMERAWQRRDEWRAIGEAAATRIRTLVPEDPAAVMAATILRVATSLDRSHVRRVASVVTHD
ncbi:MAG TPA: glycosyltransferase family 4 protein [Thermoanaerobaculia bacterium]|nr:glycosyltransferase family 4 protein [Thermoanaerobaculia bacterium]